jgi:hypothetical protein
VTPTLEAGWTKLSAMDILAQIDAEIATLKAARALITGEPAKKKIGRPVDTTTTKKKMKRNLSPEAVRESRLL